MNQVTKVIKPLHERHFKSVRHDTNDHLAKPPYETTLEDITNPLFWSCQASKMRAGEFIRVVPEGMEWYAHLLIVHATQHEAQVKVLEYKVLSDAVKLASDDYRVERDGRWFKVFRNADNVMIGGAQKSQAEADKLLSDTVAGA